MKTKTFNLLFASVFALVFLIGFTSATLTVSGPTTALSQTSGSFNFTVSSNQNETVDLTLTPNPLSDGSGHYINFQLSSESITIDTVSNPSNTITVDYVVDSGFDFDFTKTYTVTLGATGTVSSSATDTVDFKKSDFCESADNKGELKVIVEGFEVTEGYGDEEEWFAFDKVEVEITVENKGNEDIDNIVLEWGLYNTKSKEWTIEVDEEDEFDLDSDDEETITVTFTLDDNMDEDLSDLEEGDYTFYVRATGEIADGTYEGDDTCSTDSETGNLILEDDFVVLSNLKVPEVAQCDSEIQILGDAWNIGSDDQNDVYVNIYNKELGIDEDVEVGDVDSFESSDFEYTLKLPEDVQEKKYYLTLTVYDEDDDVYENSNDDKSILNAPLTVQGNCAVAKASVTAVLESGGQAGKPMVVKASITNTGKKVAYYSLNVAGYTGWASSVALDKNALTLNAGESAEVLLTFNVKKDALGSNLFNLEVLAGDELIVNQPVQVEITKRTWGITGNFLSGDNKYIWGIGLLNLVLIILIIVIAVRIARK
ncbi:MAG: putative S-layer protein [Nanobdellota archaeon]